MAIVWASKKPTDGIVTLYDSNVTLNKAASTRFEDVHFVMLGIDSETKELVIKPVTKDELELGHIPNDKIHKITVRASYARVCNKKFMREIQSVLQIDLSRNRSVKCVSRWNDRENSLLVDLDKMEV